MVAGLAWIAALAFTVSCVNAQVETIPRTSTISTVRWERVIPLRERVFTNTVVFDGIRCDTLTLGLSNKTWTACVTAIGGGRERTLPPILITQKDILDEARVVGVRVSVATNYFGVIHDLVCRRARAQLVAVTEMRVRTPPVVSNPLDVEVAPVVR
jgi:hypothetical protein